MTRISHWPFGALAVCMLAAMAVTGCGLFDDDGERAPEIAFEALSIVFAVLLGFVALLVVAAGLTIWSGLLYVRAAWPILRQQR